jgi:hypothetical protein
MAGISFSADDFRWLFAKLVHANECHEDYFLQELGLHPDTIAKALSLLSGVTPSDLMMLCSFLKQRSTPTQNKLMFGSSEPTQRAIVWDTARRVRQQLYDKLVRSWAVSPYYLTPCLAAREINISTGVI